MMDPRTTFANFQSRCRMWFAKCFGRDALFEREKRALRFGEDAITILQSCYLTEGQVHELVEYVYARRVGGFMESVGSTMVNLTVLSECHHMDLIQAAEAEYARISEHEEILRIREQEKRKPPLTA